LLQTLPFVHAAPLLPPAAPHPVVAPQLVRLVRGSTHVPPQLICRPGQETPQLPFAQTLPAAHEEPALPPPTPHAPVAPQFERLVNGSMQTPPQLICKPGHDTEHVPLPQTMPTAHALPALPPATPQPAVAPQYARLVLGSTQVPPHSIWLPGQETLHVPSLQTLPLLQATPALPPGAPQPVVAPQWVRLLRGSMQLPPQLVCELGQETWQVPLEQTCPLAHALPALPAPPTPHPGDAPQKARLLSGSMHAPPQSTRLAWHATWQVPAEHTRPAAHVLPHTPQFVRSALRFAQ